MGEKVSARITLFEVDKYSFFHLHTFFHRFLDFHRFFILWHLRHDVEQAGGDDVAGHGEESWCQAGLSQHSKFDFIETNSLVISSPVPTRNVQQVRLGKITVRRG